MRRKGRKKEQERIINKKNNYSYNDDRRKDWKNSIKDLFGIVFFVVFNFFFEVKKNNHIQGELNEMK
jgi:hypothetical protein